MFTHDDIFKFTSLSLSLYLCIINKKIVIQMMIQLPVETPCSCGNCIWRERPDSNGVSPSTRPSPTSFIRLLTNDQIATRWFTRYHTFINRRATSSVRVLYRKHTTVPRNPRRSIGHGNAIRNVLESDFFRNSIALNRRRETDSETKLADKNLPGWDFYLFVALIRQFKTGMSFYGLETER